MKLTLKNTVLNISESEFNVIEDVRYHPIVIYDKLSNFDREIGFIKELKKIYEPISDDCFMIDYGTTHGGYIPIFVNKYTGLSVKICTVDINQLINIMSNTDIQIVNSLIEPKMKSFVLRINTGVSGLNMDYSDYQIIICDKENIIDTHSCLKFEEDRYVHVNRNIYYKFFNHFNNHIVGQVLYFNNLINMLVMVKNGGDDFLQMLKHNKSYADRWTILDTGSTDNTIENIKSVMSSHNGCLYQEPFINFRDSRNRLLELAGTDCTFNLMLDDTYCLNGELRSFLTTVRGFDNPSYSLFIVSSDVKYASSRITNSQYNLKYKYTIHEVIDSRKESLLIPFNVAHIIDNTSQYMSNRTFSRKQYDIERLYDDMKTYPEDRPRILYYLAETYLCIEDTKNAIHYYDLRSKEKTGYTEETYDALYKKAYLSGNVEEYYLDAYYFDSNRYESLFMIGYTNYEKRNYGKAYEFLKLAFEMGEPDVAKYQMNLKLQQFSFHLPKSLADLCFMFKNYDLGIECIDRILKYDSSNSINTWKTSFNLLRDNSKQDLSNITKRDINKDVKVLCFVMDGGWSNWDGTTLNKTGLGGSETCLINYAEELAKDIRYKIIVFCKCDSQITHNNVEYVNILNFADFIYHYNIHLLFINRYTEILPLAIENKIDSVIMLHDLTREHERIPDSIYLKNIFCLSNWHCEHFKNKYPELAHKVAKMSYGLSSSLFNPTVEKKKLSFIYSSFPTRGLYYLLKLFPLITHIYPEARLNVFCDLEHEWSNSVGFNMMSEIRNMIEKQKGFVTNHGWVDKKTLYSYFDQSHIWFYPCIFEETYCLTALEASLSKTLVVTCDKAALSETVGSRGIVIPGEPSSDKWQEIALIQLFHALDEPTIQEHYINENYKWGLNQTVSNQVQNFKRVLKL